ncbi:MAG: hypothetical protein HZB99_03805 [Candidatus Harrisonbacteria bacterium]|nr:hypothetical protein [Candidatus Harrisonbacteria bacterium]
MKQARDISAKGFVPKHFGWVKVENLEDLHRLGKKKLIRLMKYWIASSVKAREKLRLFQNRYMGQAQYWGSWQGDARWGGEAQYCGLGRYTRKTHRTFLWQKLPSIEKSKYKALYREVSEIETRIISLQSLLRSLFSL